MSSIFYDHLIIIEEVVIVFDRYNISKKDQKKLISLMDQTLHTNILEVILTHLPKKQHEDFLNMFIQNPNDPRLFDIIKKQGNKNIVKKILNRANKVKKDMIHIIEETIKES